MSRELPRAFSTNSGSSLSPSKQTSDRPNSRHLSVLPATKGRLTRGQVAARLNVSVSTVRRLEGERLHPTVDQDDARWFDEKEVAALAAEMVNQGSKRLKAKPVSSGPSEQRPAGEIAALVFEHFEQRQSHAEIVIGLRIEPALVGELFDQYCIGLTERQLRKREPRVPLVGDIEQVHRGELEQRLAGLHTSTLTRLSIARWRGVFPAGDDCAEYAWLIELGGFAIAGPCTANEITRRYGPGSYRVTAFDLDSPQFVGRC